MKKMLTVLLGALVSLSAVAGVGEDYKVLKMPETFKYVSNENGSTLTAHLSEKIATAEVSFTGHTIDLLPKQEAKSMLVNYGNLAEPLVIEVEQNQVAPTPLRYRMTIPKGSTIWFTNGSDDEIFTQGRIEYSVEPGYEKI